MTTSTVKRRRSPVYHTAATDNTTAAATTTTATSTATSVTNISKSSSEDSGNWSASANTYINPFVHRLVIDSNLELIKIYILTVTLLPVRLLGCIVCLLIAWLFASIGMLGHSVEDINQKPLSGWRKRLQLIAASFMRLLYAFASFHYVTFKGKPATSKEAPILVVAPHSSYVDSIIIAATGPPAIVAKKETSDIPILGKIISFAQPIYVQREDPNSRQNTVREIIKRARSDEDWSHIVIFAEGTCTNRKALIKFKAGAFYPGVPVQPVLLRYPNKYDTFTWTWDGPRILRLLWMTMSQFYSNCEIEYLPVYTPTDEEKNDPNLYAHNVRDVMARSLGLPTCEYSFEDIVIMSKARNMKVPFSADIGEIEETLKELNLLDNNNEIKVLVENYSTLPKRHAMDITTLADLLKINIKSYHLHKLFQLLDKHRNGTINLRKLLLCTLFCELKSSSIMDYLKSVLKLYSDPNGCMTRQQFHRLLQHSENLKTNQINALYLAIDHTNKGSITFEEFENYVREHVDYKFLLEKQTHIVRRNQK